MLEVSAAQVTISQNYSLVTWEPWLLSPAPNRGHYTRGKPFPT